MQDGQGTVGARTRVGDEPFCDLALEHHGPVLEALPQVEQRTQERCRNRIGQIRDHTLGLIRLGEPGSPVDFARVGMDQFDIVGQQGFRFQRPHETRVDFDRANPFGTGGQRAGQNPEPRPDFEDEIAGARTRPTGQLVRQTPIHQEILSEIP